MKQKGFRIEKKVLEFEKSSKIWKKVLELKGSKIKQKKATSNPLIEKVNKWKTELI